MMNKGAGSSSSRKRKTPEGGNESPVPPPHLLRLRCHREQPHLDTVLRLRPGPHAPCTEEQGGLGGGELDLTMTSPVTSFTLLLNGDGFKDDDHPANLHFHNHFIDQALKRNNEHVKGMLEEMFTRENEQMAKKMKEKEEEIDQAMTKIAKMEQMMKSVEQTNHTLSAALEAAMTRHMTAQQAREDEVNSSSVQPGQIVVVRNICKVCWVGPATMMAWPCRHLCMCTVCLRSTNRCPICKNVFGDSVEVKFS